MIETKVHKRRNTIAMYFSSSFKYWGVYSFLQPLYKPKKDASYPPFSLRGSKGEFNSSQIQQ